MKINREDTIAIFRCAIECYAKAAKALALNSIARNNVEALAEEAKTALHQLLIGEDVIIDR